MARCARPAAKFAVTPCGLKVGVAGWDSTRVEVDAHGLLPSAHRRRLLTVYYLLLTVHITPCHGLRRRKHARLDYILTNDSKADPQNDPKTDP